MIVNVHDAKTNLSKLLVQVEAGQEVVIARGGTPVARLVKVEPAGRRRLPPPESWKGKVWMDPNMAEVDAELERLFYGESE